MRPPLGKPININAMARKIDVDNRIPLRNYYRIADNLLKQANIYREENNIIDLYIMLLRYSSLVMDTIKNHRDFQVLCPKERAYSKKQLRVVVDELESLKEKCYCKVDELNKSQTTSQYYQPAAADGIQYGSDTSSFEWPPVNNKVFAGSNNKQLANRTSVPLWKQNNDSTQVLPSNSVDVQLQKLSLLPPPKKETLSRHSFLGPNGLRGQWTGPSMEIKVQYPSYPELTSSEDLSLNQAGKHDVVAVKDVHSGLDGSNMESVLSLDDGRWLRPSEESYPSFENEARNGHFLLGNIRQPSPPPVLAQVHPECGPISPARVADPRPGPAKSFQDDSASSNTYQHLHIPVKMMQDFLRLAQENTRKNLETCGVLAGSLKNRVFHITALIIPKQESTSDSCSTLNEEEIFEIQDKHSLFPLGWIHTHPSQTCFMSSVDLHTHYSYQIMLPEAIAIVMAPTDTSSPHGIFHLSDPAGVSLIRNCQERGFHPHEEPDDGSPIYEHCSHVYMNPTLKFDVVDLR